MWLIARYAPTALFSLKLSIATSSGGKTLLAPTPYALKMALLDVAYRTVGIVEAELLWPKLRGLQVAYRPPQFAAVTNLFTRVLKLNRAKPDPEAQPVGPFGKTIGYREYVQFSEPLGIALEANGETPFGHALDRLLSSLNYMGKRGGFVQIVAPPQATIELPSEFVRLNPPGGQTQFDARGVLQMLDDCSPDMTAARANAFSGESIRAGKERLCHPIVLPYRLVRASKSYTLYQRLD